MLQRKNLLLVEDDAIVLSELCELLLASDEYYITKAKNILNWKPEIEFEEGIRMTVEYYTKHISKYL